MLLPLLLRSLLSCALKNEATRQIAASVEVVEVTECEVVVWRWLKAFQTERNSMGKDAEPKTAGCV